MPENRELAIDWPDVVNEDGTPMRWFGAWLVGDEGAEGAWFHSGRGAASTAHTVPPDATGMRVRRWPNEGLAAEYADLIPVPPGPVEAAEAPFERQQAFSLLAAETS